MKVCCVEDAPVAPPPSLHSQRPHLDKGYPKGYPNKGGVLDNGEGVGNVTVGDQSVKNNGNNNHNLSNVDVTSIPNKGWPVVVMCHGLGGTRVLYSQLCITLASR